MPGLLAIQASSCKPPDDHTPYMSRTSERARQPEHVLGQVGKNEVRRDGGNLIQPRFAELALDVVFARKAKAAMSLQTHVGRLPRRLRREKLCHVGFGAARFSGIIQIACL